MKRLYFNIFFQIIALIIIIRIIFFESENFNKFLYLFTPEIIPFFLLAIFIKVFLTYLFFILINIISAKKNSYLDITTFFLQGGIINQLLPGVGFVYKYYALKKTNNVNLAEYATAQIVWSVFVFASYLFLGTVLGFIIISLSYLQMSLIFTIITITIFIAFVLRNMILKYILNRFSSLFKNSIFFHNLKNVYELILNKIHLFIPIFIGFIILATIECFHFNYGLNIFEAGIPIISSNFVFITTSLASFFTIINFFGLFEFLLTLSSSIVIPEFGDMLIYAFSFRILNLSATLFVIFNINFYKTITIRK